MKRFAYLVVGLAILAMPVVAACQKAEEKTPPADASAAATHEFTQAEITASVPEVKDRFLPCS